MIRRLLLSLSIVVFLTACQKEQGPGYNPPKLAEQTVLVYMPGRSLLSFYQTNIEGIRKAVTAQIPGRGRILVCYQPANQRSAELSEIYFDTNHQKAASMVLKVYNTFDAGNPADVQQLFADAAAIAPGKQYGLIIGCHGKAWIPAKAGVLKVSSLDKHSDGGQALDSWEPMPGALVTRSFGDPGYELDIEELAEAISSQALKPEYLIFDDCFMANIEVFYDLRRVVPYVVASPCEIMGAGFPYERIIPRLFAGNNTRDNLEKSCFEFWDFYMNHWETVPYNAKSGCISLAVMSEIDALAEVMKRINSSPQKQYDPAQLQTYEGLAHHAFYDLQHYVESSCGDPALVAQFNTILDRAMPPAGRFNTPTFYSVYNDRANPVTNYSGITTSLPSRHSLVTPYIQQTNWYRATQ